MSVLVEALSLIIPRTVLDISYPGGTDAFMLKMCDPTVPCRLVCADDELVSVSFLGAEQSSVVEEELMSLGIVAEDDECFVEMAFVDQERGPTRPCDWIEWRRHEDGFTCCWLAGTDPDPMHAPANWTPAQSRSLSFHDYRDEPGRCLRLAEDGGKETWLDFRTGLITSGLDPLAAPAPVVDDAPDLELEKFIDELMAEGDGPPLPESGVLMGVVRAMLDSHGYTYQCNGDESVTFLVRHESATVSVFCTVTDATSLVQFSTAFGSNVPEARRVAVAEALTRINVRLGLGNFEMFFPSGEVRFRIGIDVEDGLLSKTMTDNMLGFALHTMERFHTAIMRVAFGDVEPAVAIEEVA